MRIIRALILIAVILVSSCKKDDTETVVYNDLELVNSFDLNVKEPSGLAIDVNKAVLYTVSDNTNNLYKITKEAKVLQEYDINADDLEGVCLYNSDLLLANESNKQLIEYNVITENTSVHTLIYDNTEPNSGLEGVAYNKSLDVVYALNEKSPGLLLIIDNKFNVINEIALNFADDYSGLFYDSINDLLWIVSDESSSINKCNTKGDLLKSYKINVNKSEGIAIDIENGIIYVICDSDSKMYVFKINN